MSIVYCVVQSAIPFVDTGTKRAFSDSRTQLIIMKAVFIHHISKVNPHVRPHFLTNGYCEFLLNGGSFNKNHFKKSSVKLLSASLVGLIFIA